MVEKAHAIAPRSRAIEGVLPKMPSAVPMARKLAYRNLLHDRVSLLVTLVGIVFSVVLIAIMGSIYLGMTYRILAVMDHIQADLWVVPVGTKSFDLPTVLLPGRERHAALSTPGVERADDLIISFSNWSRMSQDTNRAACATETGDCGTTSILLIGADTDVNPSLPWDLVDGKIGDLSTPKAVAIDSTYFKELAIERIGDRAEINDVQVTVKAVTLGIRSFTTMPFVFTTLPLARTLVNATEDRASYTLVRVASGSNVEDVRRALQARLPNTEVLTHEAFRERSLNYWLYDTGAGSAVITGALLAIIVGIVVVAQTLYASTKEHINEFATLRALGGSSRFICKVILWQAVLSAIMGYVVGMMLSYVAVQSLRDLIPIVMTFNLVWTLLVMTIAMCVLAAASAIAKVVRIDPAVVFSR
jgi:putative ABC transport system permease protein